MKLSTRLVLLFVLVSSLTWGQTAGDWHSNATGNWNASATWQRLNSDLVTWESFGVGQNTGLGYPNAAELGTATIQSGHTVTWNAASIICGPVIVASGGILIHGSTAGTYASLTVNGSLILGTTGTSNKVMNVIGDLLVGSTGSIACAAGTAAGNKHTVNIGGNLINNGSITPTAVSTTFTTKNLFVFNKQGIAIFSTTGTPTSTAIGNLTVYNGTTLDIQIPVTIGGTTVSVVVDSGLITSSGNGSIIYSTLNSANSITYCGKNSQQTTGPELNGVSVPSVTVNNSYGIMLGSDVTVRSTLTMTSGNIALNGKNLVLGTSTVSPGTLTYTAGNITGIGTFKRWLGTTIAGTAGTFPMGVGSNSRSIIIGGTPTTGGSVRVSYTDAGTVSQPFGPSFLENSQTFVNRLDAVWTVSIIDSLTGSGLTLSINGNGIQGINAITDLTISGATAAAPGTYAAPSGTTTAPVFNRQGLTDITLPSSYYVASTSNSSLPVELSSFSASTIGSTVELKWTTATEVNNRGFEILRAGKDNIFGKIGFINGNGNSNTENNYSIKDNPGCGIFNYQIKQIDFNGNCKYSNMVEVNISIPTKLLLGQNYPNPFNPSTVIRFDLPKATHILLSVYNSLGQKVATLANDYLREGSYVRTFDGTGLATGIYVYKLSTDESVITKKMVLIK